MRTNRFTLFIAASVVLAIYCSGCDDDPPPIDQLKHEIELSLNHQWRGGSLELDGWYLTSNSDSFQLTKLVYHINHFEFIDSNGKGYPADKEWFMVNSEETLNPVWTMGDLDDETFTSVRFTIGVADSMVNATGALSSVFTVPMYWGIANGYINFKLEGMSPSAPTDTVIFHTGGYVSPYQAFVQVEVEFPDGSEVSSKVGSNNVSLIVDLADCFDNPNLIDLSITNEVNKPSDDAVKISENWPGMFSFGSVK